jgi:hypothetical protein
LTAWIPSTVLAFCHMSGNRRQITVRLDDRTIANVEKARGRNPVAISREDWLRYAIDGALSRERDYQSRLLDLDRLEREGAERLEKLEKELRRLADEERERRSQLEEIATSLHGPLADHMWIESFKSSARKLFPEATAQADAIAEEINPKEGQP